MLCQESDILLDLPAISRSPRAAARSRILLTSWRTAMYRSFQIVCVHSTSFPHTSRRMSKVSLTIHPTCAAGPTAGVDMVQLFPVSNLANWQSTDSYGIVEY